jgi:hypothetical protein
VVAKVKPLALHKHLRKRTLSLTKAQMVELRVPDHAMTQKNLGNVRLVSATPERRPLGMSASPAPRFNTEKIEPIRFGLSPSKSPTKSPQRNDPTETSPSRNLSITPNLALRNLNSDPATASNPNKSAAQFKLMTSLINQAKAEPNLPPTAQKNQYADQVLDDVDERSQDFASVEEDQQDKPVKIFDTPFVKG